MAWRMMMLSEAGRKFGFELGFRRYTCIPQLQPLGFPTFDVAVNPNFALPEFDRNPNTENKGIGIQFPSFNFGGGSMELMAVPKRKTSPHKRGIRNGPKALKPVPVIVLCKGCGRVKRPHFFCCSGNRENQDEHSSSNG